MDRLETLLEKQNKTEEEEREEERLLRDYAKTHNITFHPEYGWE